MNLDELKKLAEGNRTQVEIGTALILSVLVLAVVTLAPVPGKTEEPVSEAIAAPVPVFPEMSLEAEAAVVYDLTTQTVLYDKHAEVPLPLASITKLLTVSAAAGSLSLEGEAMVTEEVLQAVRGGELGSGETFAVSDLMGLALVASSNAAAETLARAVEEERAENSSRMLANAAAAAGLFQTHAVNGTGLDESASVAGGYGSALDAALLAGNLVRTIPALAALTTESSVSVLSKEGVRYTLPNTNPYVEEMPSLLFSKTGYTRLAGGNLVVVFDVGINHHIAIAVLGSTEEGRFTDVQNLIEATRSYLGEYYSS